MCYLSSKQPHVHCMGLLLFGIMKIKRGVTMLSSGAIFVIFVLLSTVSVFLYVLVKEIGNGKAGEKKILQAGAWVGWALTVAAVYELNRRSIVNLIVVEVVITFFVWHYTKNTPPPQPPIPPNQPPTP